jgi:F-type H+-transporting ATPase subunit a
MLMSQGISVQGPLVSFSFELFGYQVMVSESIVIQFFITVGLILLFFVLGRNLKLFPETRKQMLAETIYHFFTDMVHTNMGVKNKNYIPYIGGLFCLSICSSLTGLLGLRTPTSDLSVTLAWGCITLVMIWYTKFKTGGIKGFLSSFVTPVPFMLPFNIIGEFANPFSQSVRHFANLLGGSVIGALLYYALGHVANGLGSIGIPAVLSLYFDLFSAVIQAYIFCMLTMAYVSSAEAD